QCSYRSALSAGGDDSAMLLTLANFVVKGAAEATRAAADRRLDDLRNPDLLPPRTCTFGTQRCPRDDDWNDGSPAFKARLLTYARQHAADVDPTSPPAAAPRRFLVYTATNDGMGNKLLPLV